MTCGLDIGDPRVFDDLDAAGAGAFGHGLDDVGRVDAIGIRRVKRADDVIDPDERVYPSCFRRTDDLGVAAVRLIERDQSLQLGAPSLLLDQVQRPRCA